MKVITTYQFDFMFDFDKNFVFLEDIATAIQNDASLKRAVEIYKMDGKPEEHFSWFPVKYKAAERKAAKDNDIELPAWIPLYYEENSYDDKWSDIDFFQGNVRVALHWPFGDDISYRVTGQDNMAREAWSECQALWREQQKKKTA